MNSQPEALRLADALEIAEISYTSMVNAAYEMRRLNEANQDLVNALKMLHEAFCSEDYGTSEGRLQARKALIATRECLKKNEQS